MAVDPKPDDIPQDVWDTADAVTEFVSDQLAAAIMGNAPPPAEGMIKPAIARAFLADRRRVLPSTVAEPVARDDRSLVLAKLSSFVHELKQYPHRYADDIVLLEEVNRLLASPPDASRAGVTDGPTYYTEGKDAQWFEALDDVEFAKRASYAAMDIADGDFGLMENYLPVCAILSDAADRIKRLISILGTVEVKPLEWGAFGATTVLASSYYLQYYDDATWGWHLAMGPEQSERYQTADEAKAAAQADYQKRILSALSAAPQPQAFGRDAVEGEPIPKHIQFRRDVLAKAATLDGSDFAADFDVVDDNTVDGLARTVAIVLAGYGWTVNDEGRLAACVAGDQGYATTGIVLDAETIAALASPKSQPSRDEVIEALKPFAEYLDTAQFDLDNKGKPLPDDQGMGWVYLTVGDFRRARTAIRKIKEGKAK